VREEAQPLTYKMDGSGYVSFALLKKFLFFLAVLKEATASKVMFQ